MDILPGCQKLGTEDLCGRPVANDSQKNVGNTCHQFLLQTSVVQRFEINLMNEEVKDWEPENSEVTIFGIFSKCTSFC